MKKAVAMAGLVTLAIWLAVVLIQTYAEDPEPHTTTPERDPEPAPDRADTIVSDPGLLIEQPFRIRETARASDGTILENAPFLIVLRDGRYAFGYTNKSGEAMSLFARESVDYEVYFYEEAWSHLHALDAGR